VSAPRFHFRLERVRALRERAEREATEHLAASLADHARGVEDLRAAEGRMAAAQDSRRGAGGLSGADLLASQAWLERIERARHAAALDVDRREADVDARRGQLVQAARDHRALQRLAERRRAEHDARVARIEGDHLDELALTVHRRGAAR
jgi:flagellar FliJ protein